MQTMAFTQTCSDMIAKIVGPDRRTWAPKLFRVAMKTIHIKTWNTRMPWIHRSFQFTAERNATHEEGERHTWERRETSRNFQITKGSTVARKLHPEHKLSVSQVVPDHRFSFRSEGGSVEEWTCAHASKHIDLRRGGADVQTAPSTSVISMLLPSSLLPSKRGRRKRRSNRGILGTSRRDILHAGRLIGLTSATICCFSRRFVLASLP